MKRKIFDGFRFTRCYYASRLSLRHNDALPSSKTVPRADYLEVANLRSYSLSCTAASSDACVPSLIVYEKRGCQSVVFNTILGFVMLLCCYSRFAKYLTKVIQYFTQNAAIDA